MLLSIFAIHSLVHSHHALYPYILPIPIENLVRDQMRPVIPDHLNHIEV